MKHLSSRTMPRLVTALLTLTLLVGMIPVTALAANVPTVSADGITRIVLADAYESIGHVSKDMGNIYLETTLGDPYFDGVRIGDTLTMHINVEKAGTYQWCMVTGWAKDVKNGTFTLYIDGEEAARLVNQVGGIEWRVWLDTTHGTVTLPAGNHELKIVFGSDGPNVMAIKFAPEGVDMNVKEGVTPLCEADSGTPVQVTDDYAIQFCMTVPFDYVTVACPSYNNNVGSFRLELFTWQDNYDTTVKGKALASKDFVNFNDNATLKLDCGKELPAGEYVLRLSNVSEDRTEQIGVWTSKTAPANVRNYQNGIEINNAARMNVHWIGTTDTPLGKISLNAEASPVYEEFTGSMKDLSAYNLPASSLYHSARMMPDTWVFTDALGRKSLTNADVGDPKENKTLAMFYWIWHCTFSKIRTPLNVQQFIDERTEAGIPMESYIHDFNYAEWPSAMGAQYFWDEPIWGFYASDDVWVQRKQAELLAAAGVDVVFSDNSNATLVWQDAYPALYETWTQAQKDGVKTPKISYLMPFAPGSDTQFQLNHYYTNIFHDGKYQSLWFWWDGKPMLMAYEQSLGTSVLDKQIKEFFTFRPGQPSYFMTKETGNWGWLSVYPQALHYAKNDRKQPEQITVGVAQNANYEHNELAAMNGGPIMGRSYTKDRSHLGEKDSTLWGWNFNEQFTYALSKDPKVIFVTGWNEWCASRYEAWPDGGHSVVTNAFPDQFNDEYSRDLEPSRGALGDNYYYQFVNFARQFKGVEKLPLPGAAKTIDMGAGQGQWADVAPYFAASIGNIGDRDSDGYKGTHYSDYSGRNDIIGAQVERDDEYLYFNVECASDITPYTDKLWMNLYIDCNEDNAGWNTFDFVVNKSRASAGTVVLERFTGTGYESEKVADCAYTLDGRYMTVAVKKADLGLSGYDFTVNFAWTDNVHDVADTGLDTDKGLVYTTFSGDILDFYTSGDVAPGGRFKYSYVSTSENAGVAQSTDAPTEPETDPGTEPETTASAAESEQGTASSGKGCKSVLTAAVLPAAAAALFIAKKKKESD